MFLVLLCKAGWSYNSLQKTRLHKKTQLNRWYVNYNLKWQHRLKITHRLLQYRWTLEKKTNYEWWRSQVSITNNSRVSWIQNSNLSTISNFSCTWKTIWPRIQFFDILFRKTILRITIYYINQCSKNMTGPSQSFGSTGDKTWSVQSRRSQIGPVKNNDKRDVDEALLSRR